MMQLVDACEAAVSELGAPSGADEDLVSSFVTRGQGSVARLATWESGCLRLTAATPVSAVTMRAFLDFIFDPTATDAVDLLDNADNRALVTLAVHKAMETVARTSHDKVEPATVTRSKRRLHDESSDDEHSDDGKKRDSTLEAYDELQSLQGRTVPLHEKAVFTGKAYKSVARHGYFPTVPALGSLKMMGCAAHGRRLRVSKDVEIELEAGDKVTAALSSRHAFCPPPPPSALAHSPL